MCIFQFKSFKKSSSVSLPAKNNDTHLLRNLFTTQAVLLQKLVHDTSTKPEEGVVNKGWGDSEGLAHVR